MAQLNEHGKYVKWKELDTEGHMSHDSIYVKHQESHMSHDSIYVKHQEPANETIHVFGGPVGKRGRNCLCICVPFLNDEMLCN